MADDTDSPDTAGDDEIRKWRFGRRRGGVPKDVREELPFAVTLSMHHERGMSIPQVALNYRYEPIQAMTMIVTCCQGSGFSALVPHVPRHVMSLVPAQYPDAPALHPSTRPQRNSR
jgi:hypothetical protein